VTGGGRRPKGEGMTIGVYRLSAAGECTVLRPPELVELVGPLLMMGSPARYPECECPRCSPAPVLVRHPPTPEGRPPESTGAASNGPVNAPGM
jgi:hypothetical protein